MRQIMTLATKIVQAINKMPRNASVGVYTMPDEIKISAESVENPINCIDIFAYICWGFLNIRDMANPAGKPFRFKTNEIIAWDPNEDGIDLYTGRGIISLVSYPA